MDAQFKVEVAKLDIEGILIEIIAVPEDQWITDPAEKKVKLDNFHDMKGKEGQYKYDWNIGAFIPLKRRFSAFDDDRAVISAMVESIIEIVKALNKADDNKVKPKISAAAKHILGTWS
jgi:hypothetical protein